MTWVDYLMYLGVCMAATATPGPAVVLAVRNGARYGRRRALLGVLGNVAAMITLACITALGLGALILASQTLFTALKVLGGLYLVYLGLKILLDNKAIWAPDEVTARLKTNASLFRESYLVGLSNPKAFAFYTALFPQFIDLSAPVLTQFLVLTSTFACSSLLLLMVYASLATQMRRYLQQAGFSQWFNRLTGGAFVGFGVALVSVR